MKQHVCQSLGCAENPEASEAREAREEERKRFDEITASVISFIATSIRPKAIVAAESVTTASTNEFRSVYADQRHGGSLLAFVSWQQPCLANSGNLH